MGVPKSQFAAFSLFIQKYYLVFKQRNAPSSQTGIGLNVVGVVYHAQFTCVIGEGAYGARDAPFPIFKKKERILEKDKSVKKEKTLQKCFKFSKETFL